MNTYSIIENNPFFEGMPPFDPMDENGSLAELILFKIQTVGMPDIIWGKKNVGGVLVEEDFRQYEFQLSAKDDRGKSRKDYGIFYLFIKNKKHFFIPQPEFELMHGGIWQKIPLTYQTLSKMTDSEQSIIYWDLD